MDLSYNRLTTVAWYALSMTLTPCLSTRRWKHVSPGNPRLEWGKKFKKSDFQKIAYLYLNSVFLGLKTLSYYEEGSLPILNMTKLYIVLPMDTNFWVLLCDGIKTSKILEMTNIGGKDQFASYETKKYLISENSETCILLLNKVNLLWDELLLIFQCVWHMSVEYFQIQHVSLGGTIYLDHNSFDNSNTVTRTVKLDHVHFYISQESVYLFFTKMDIENLTETLITMNLSSNKFDDSVFRCLPTSIQTLDLQNNKIQTVPKEIIHLKSLQGLNLAFNFLTDLPGCSHFKKTLNSKH